MPPTTNKSPAKKISPAARQKSEISLSAKPKEKWEKRRGDENVFTDHLKLSRERIPRVMLQH